MRHAAAAPASRPSPAGLRENDEVPDFGGSERYLSEGSRRSRQGILVIFIALFLIGPLAVGFDHHRTPKTTTILVGGVVFLLVTGYLLVAPTPRPGRVPWPLLILNVALAVFLFILGGSESFLVIPAIAAAACGRFACTDPPAAFGAITCGAAGLLVAVHNHFSLGNAVIVTGVPPMTTFFAYSAAKRNEAQETVRQTRAELARVAVAEERLRIARDLHDLLGHSLSLITLKAELSRRMMATDAAGAEREISELEAVARQSLSDVREAVAGYRQPDLAAELGAARQLLTAAGVACRISAPEGLSLPGEVDTVLAWAVREGVTNVVRHAQATSAVITVAADPSGVTAEITDNGRGSAARAPTGTGPATGAVLGAAASDGMRRVGGSGLAGLGERVRKLGGELAAAPSSPAGFRLRVTIPACGPAAAPPT